LALMGNADAYGGSSTVSNRTAHLKGR